MKLSQLIISIRSIVCSDIRRGHVILGVRQCALGDEIGAINQLIPASGGATGGGNRAANSFSPFAQIRHDFHNMIP